MFTVTPEAAKQIELAVQNSDAQDMALRIAAKRNPDGSVEYGMGFDEIARQIYSHHQVESVYLMSGGFDLTVIIKGRTMREVARFVSEQLAPMENVLSTGTHFILKKYKDNSVEFDPADSDKREVMAW